MTGLLKLPFVESANRKYGAWAFENHDDPSSISDDYYALAVPNREVGRLDDLDYYEEAEFWNLTFAVAKNVAETKGFDPLRPQILLVGLNDGVYAGQSIPHVHSHILVVKPDNIRSSTFDMYSNMDRTFDELEKQFRPAAQPLSDRKRLQCDLRDIGEFTTRLRYLRERMNAEKDKYFRIYTHSALSKEITSLFVTVDSCTAENPQFSFSQAWRAIHGKMSFQRLDCKFGYGKFTHFAKAGLEAALL